MRTVGLLAVFLAVALPVAATSAGIAAVDGPVLAQGDFWTYRTNTSLGSGFYLGGLVTITVKNRALADVEGTSYDAYVMSVAGSGTAVGTVTTQFGSAPASGQWELSGQDTVEARGMKVVSSVVDLEANGTLNPQSVPLSFRLSVQNTTSFRVREDAWRFPLGVGNSTTVRSELNFTQDIGLFYGFPTTPTHSFGIVSWNVTYAVEAQEAVDTPAGHFDTFRIRETDPDGSYRLSFFAPAAGNDARTEIHNKSSTIATWDLVAYRYQALEPSRFLGLTPPQWAITSLIVAAAVFIGFLWIRRRQKKRGASGSFPPRT